MCFKCAMSAQKGVRLKFFTWKKFFEFFFKFLAQCGCSFCGYFDNFITLCR